MSGAGTNHISGILQPACSLYNHCGGYAMLGMAVVFFIIAIIAAVFGFGGIAAGAAGIAKILFVIFVILFLLTLISGAVRGRGPRV
jgi:uncharacterized membrane protein YtjA (UPF0391 family)